MTHPSKRKGNAFERELVADAIAAGLSAKRAYASNGESLGQSAEVDLLVDDRRIQAKRRKSIPGWLGLEDGVDAVVLRQDRGESVVVLRWIDYLQLVAEG